MSAHRTVTLACDKPGCRERYVCGDGQNPSQVRAEAHKLAGWSSHRQAADQSPTRIDLCRWHA